MADKKIHTKLYLDLTKDEMTIVNQIKKVTMHKSNVAVIRNAIKHYYDSLVKNDKL